MPIEDNAQKQAVINKDVQTQLNEQDNQVEYIVRDVKEFKQETKDQFSEQRHINENINEKLRALESMLHEKIEENDQK